MLPKISLNKNGLLHEDVCVDNSFAIGFKHNIGSKDNEGRTMVEEEEEGYYFSDIPVTAKSTHEAFSEKSMLDCNWAQSLTIGRKLSFLMLLDLNVSFQS